MAKTTEELKPGEVLRPQNLIRKNDAQLGKIYDSYGEVFSGSHISTKDDFVNFVKDYRIWREQMLQALPGIIAHLQKHRESVPNFRVAVQQALLDKKKYNSSDEEAVMNAEFVAENILDVLRTDYDEFFDFQSFIGRLSTGLGVYLETFGTEEITKKKILPLESSATGSATIAVPPPITFSTGDQVQTTRGTTVYYVDENKTLQPNNQEPSGSGGIILKGPAKVREHYWYLLSFTSGNSGWVVREDLIKEGYPPSRSGGGKKKFSFSSVINLFKKEEAPAPMKVPPIPPDAPVLVSRLTGAGPRTRINLAPIPPTKPWWKLWEK